MFKELKEDMMTMTQQIGNISEEVETNKKNQMKVLELKSK